MITLLPPSSPVSKFFYVTVNTLSQKILNKPYEKKEKKKESLLFPPPLFFHQVMEF